MTLDWLKTSESESGDVTVQGTDAWRAWRGKGLGSSDAAVLLGWSPWKTIEQLIDEKRGTWKQEFGAAQQRAMDRGKALEPVIRAWYERQANTTFPDAISVHPEYEFMRASFDGINHTLVNPDGSIGRIIEIKAPNAKDHELAKAEFIPEKYQPQVQWLLMVSGLIWADYVSYGTDGTYAVVPVKRDPEMQAELISRAIACWALVQDHALPVRGWIPWLRPTQKLAIELPDAEDLATQALAAQDEVRAATARLEALKERLKAWLGERDRAEVGEAVMEWQEKKGNVDYSKIPALEGIDLDLYRKKNTRSFLLKRREARD